MRVTVASADCRRCVPCCPPYFIAFSRAIHTTVHSTASTRPLSRDRFHARPLSREACRLPVAYPSPTRRLPVAYPSRSCG